MKGGAWARVVRLFAVRSDNGRPGKHRRDVTAVTEYPATWPAPRHRLELEFVAVLANDWTHLSNEAQDQAA